MQFSSSKIRVLLIILSFLIISVMILPGIILNNTSFSSLLTNMVKEELSRVFPGPVDLEKIGITGLTPELIGVTLDSPGGNPILRADRIKVYVDWINLLLHRSFPLALRRLEFINPVVWLEKNKEGYMTFPALFPGEEEPANETSANIIIEVVNGTLRVPAAGDEWPWGEFKSIYGDVDLRAYPHIIGSLQFKSVLEPEAEARIEIQSFGAEGAFQIHAANVSAALWGKKLFEELKVSREFRLLKGRALFDLNMVWGDFGTEVESVRLVLTGSELKWDKLPRPVRGLDADVTVNSGGIEIRRFQGSYQESGINLTGRILTAGSPRLDLDLYATELELKEWYTLLPDLKRWRASGEVDLKLKITGEPDAPDMRGEVRVVRGGVAVPGSPIELRNLRMLAKITEKGISLPYAEGLFNRAPFFLKGSINGWVKPRLELDVTFTGLDPVSLLPAELGLTTGLIGGGLRLEGEPAAPVVKGEVYTDTIRWRGYEGRDLRLTGEYHWGTDELKIRTLSGRVFSGEAQISGEVRGLVAAPFLRLESAWKGIDLAMIPLGEFFPGKLPQFHGEGDLDFTLEGNLSSLQGSGELNIREGTVHQFAFDRMNALFSWNGERLKSRVILTENGGTIIGNGWWEPDSQKYAGDLVLRGLEVDPRWFTEPIPPLEGRISGYMNIKRGSGGPSGEGWAELYETKLKGTPIGDLKLRGKVNADGVTLHDSFLLLESGYLGVTGGISWKDEPYYDFKINGSHILLEDILSLAPVEVPGEMTGLTDLELSVKGWNKPTLTGNLAVEGLSLYGRYFDKGEARWRWTEGALNLQSLHLYRDEGRISLSGLAQGEKLDLSVKAEEFPLASLKITAGGNEAAGNLGVNGKIRGDLKSPTFTGKLRIDRFSLAGLNLDTVTGDLFWKEKTLSVEEMKIIREDQELKAYGQVEFKGESWQAAVLDLGFKLDETKVSDLLLILGVSTKVPVDGKIAGYLRALGPVEKPMLRIIADLRDGRVDGYDSLSGELDLQVEGPTVTVNRLRIDEADGYFFASGVYTPDKLVKASVTAEGFPVAPLAALAGYDRQPGGRANFRMELDTTSRGMKGEFSGEVYDLTLGEASLSSLSLWGELQDDLLYLQGEEANRLFVRGQLPLSPEWFASLALPTSWPHRHSEVNLEFSAEELKATFFNIFLPGQFFRSGTLNGAVALKGRWEQLYLEGALKAGGLKGYTSSLPEEFREVNGELLFSEDKLTIKNIEGRYGQGRFRVTGSLLLDGLTPETLTLKTSGEKLHYKSPLFDGFFSGEVSLTGPVKRPLLSGQVVAEKTRITFAPRSGASPALDLALDLTLRTGSDVYFRQYGLANIPLEGGLHLGGTVKDPVLVGNMTATRGSVTVYGDTFRVKRAQAEFKPEYELLPYLDLEAVLYLSGTEITLATEGWVGENLILNLSSNPAKSREEIFSLLNWSERLQNQKDISLETLVEGNINTVTDTFLGPFFDQFRDLLDIDFFSLEQDRDIGDFWMNLGKSVNESLYLSYKRSLGSLTEEVWSLEWKFAPSFSLLGDYSTEKGYKWQLLYNIRF